MNPAPFKLIESKQIEIQLIEPSLWCPTTDRQQGPNYKKILP